MAWPILSFKNIPPDGPSDIRRMLMDPSDSLSESSEAEWGDPAGCFRSESEGVSILSSGALALPTSIIIISTNSFAAFFNCSKLQLSSSSPSKALGQTPMSSNICKIKLISSTLLVPGGGTEIGLSRGPINLGLNILNTGSVLSSVFKWP